VFFIFTLLLNIGFVYLHRRRVIGSSLTERRFIADGGARLRTGDRFAFDRHRLVAFERRYIVAGGRSQRCFGGRFPNSSAKLRNFSDIDKH
jgi:hypothetical protein